MNDFVENEIYRFHRISKKYIFQKYVRETKFVYWIMWLFCDSLSYIIIGVWRKSLWRKLLILNIGKALTSEKYSLLITKDIFNQSSIFIWWNIYIWSSNWQQIYVRMIPSYLIHNCSWISAWTKSPNYHILSFVILRSCM